jgi:hypothetical protein
MRPYRCAESVHEEDPVLGPEWRCHRLRELDALIAGGWGDVPFSKIEKVMRENGGTLPKLVPSGAAVYVLDESQLIIDALREGRINFVTAVYDAVSAGYTTCGEIAALLSAMSREVSKALCTMVSRGELKVTGNANKRRVQYDIIPGVDTQDRHTISPSDLLPKQDVSRVLLAVAIGKMRLIEGTYHAVCAGYQTLGAIAELFGDADSRNASARLRKLVKRGRLRVRGQLPVGTGQLTYVFEPAATVTELPLPTPGTCKCGCGEQFIPCRREQLYVNQTHASRHRTRKTRARMKEAAA